MPAKCITKSNTQHIAKHIAIWMNWQMHYQTHYEMHYHTFGRFSSFRKNVVRLAIAVDDPFNLTARKDRVGDTKRDRVQFYPRIYELEWNISNTILSVSFKIACKLLPATSRKQPPPRNAEKPKALTAQIDSPRDDSRLVPEQGVSCQVGHPPVIFHFQVESLGFVR